MGRATELSRSTNNIDRYYHSGSLGKNNMAYPDALELTCLPGIIYAPADYSENP